MLYEMISGRKPWAESREVGTILGQIISQRLGTSSLDCSGALKSVVAKATEPSPKDRYSRPRLMKSALEATPEGTEGAPAAKVQKQSLKSLSKESSN